MDEGVEQRGPGICPKCGMALVPKPSADLAEADEDDTELTVMSRRFWVALILAVPVFLLAMLPMVGIPIDRWIPTNVSNWLQALLATPIVFWAGGPFLVRGVQSVRNRSLNMFTLIALGIAAAYGYSLVTLIVPFAQVEATAHASHPQASTLGTHAEAHLYFEAAAAITVLLLFGQVLEIRGPAADHRRDSPTAGTRPTDCAAVSSTTRKSKSRSPKSDPAMCSACGRVTRFRSTDGSRQARRRSTNR